MHKFREGYENLYAGRVEEGEQDTMEIIMSA